MTYWKRSAAVLGALALGGLTACGGSDASGSGDGDVQTQNLQLATYTGPTSADAIAYDQWAERVNELSDGSLEIEVFHSESLLPAAEILPGVAAGRADLGAMSFFYYPAEVPLTFIENLPYETENPSAEAKAFEDLYESNEAFRAQYEDQGVVNLFNWIAPTPPVLGCKDPVESLDDLRGKSIRVGGLIAKSFEPLNVNVVSLAAGEVRESIERGLIDCWAGLTMDLVPDLGLDEVTPHLYDWGYGNFGTYEMLVNQQVWEGLTDEQREAANQAIAELIDQYGEITDPVMADICEEIESAGANVEVLPEAIQEEWRNLVGDAPLEAFYDLAADNGVARDVAENFYNDYVEAIERYEAEMPETTNPIARCAAG